MTIEPIDEIPRPEMFYPKDRWHLDKKVSVGHLVTTLTVVVAFVIWMQRLETQIVVHTEQIANNSTAIKEVQQAVDTQYTEIIRRLERMDDRLVMGQQSNGTAQ